MAFQLAYLHLSLAPSNVKVKVMHILTVNISQMVTDKANIAIGKNRKTCGISISRFKFYLF